MVCISVSVKAIWETKNVSICQQVNRIFRMWEVGIRASKEMEKKQRKLSMDNVGDCNVASTNASNQSIVIQFEKTCDLNKTY